jgi:hypothetical protein
LRRYKKNEIFIDAIENVNILYSNTGSLLHADVAGEIKVLSASVFLDSRAV